MRITNWGLIANVYRSTLACMSLALFVSSVSASDYSRNYGTIDSFGLIPIESLSSVAEASRLAAALAGPNTSRGDVRFADALVSKNPGDIALMMLRTQLASKLGESRPWEMVYRPPLKTSVFLHGFSIYCASRIRYPEHVGISSDWDKLHAPNWSPELIEVIGSPGVHAENAAEKLFYIDYANHVSMLKDYRSELHDLEVAYPKLWKLRLLEVCLLRCGALDVSADQHFRRKHPDEAKQYAQAFALAKKLVVAHPDCPFAWMLAGVTAKDVGEKVYARECFLKYLSNPDPGRFGSQRILDAKELLKRLAASK